MPKLKTSFADHSYKREKGTSIHAVLDLMDLCDMPIKGWEDAVGTLEVEAEKSLEECRDMWERANRGKAVKATGGQTVDSISADCFLGEKEAEELKKAIEEHGSVPLFAFLDLVDCKPFVRIDYRRAPTGVDDSNPLTGYEIIKISLEPGAGGYFSRDIKNPDVEKYKRRITAGEKIAEAKADLDEAVRDYRRWEEAARAQNLKKCEAQMAWDEALYADREEREKALENLEKAERGERIIQERKAEAARAVNEAANRREEARKDLY